jgi:hypothetical protein
MKNTGLSLLIVALLCSAAFAANENADSTKQLDQLEQTIYGNVRTGGMISRLDDIEKALYGTKLEGSLAERQSAHIDFLENGSNGQPSLLYKTSVAEWGLGIYNNADKPLMERIPIIEKKLEESALDSKPLAMRVERALGLIFTDPVSVSTAEVPAGTVVRMQLMETLKPATTKKGDHVLFRITHNVMVGNTLVVPVGAPASGVVTSVKKPGFFGRPSEIKISVDSIKTLGSAELPLIEGSASKEATEFEATYAAAAGTSLVGAIVLGPVGLVSGFFIRGNAKEVPAGSILYAETKEPVSIAGYPVPDSLKEQTAETQYVDLIQNKKVSLSKSDAAAKSADVKEKSVKTTEIDNL